MGQLEQLEVNPQPHNQRHLCSRFMTVKQCSGEMEKVSSCMQQPCTCNRAKQKIRASSGGYTADSHWRGPKEMYTLPWTGQMKQTRIKLSWCCNISPIIVNTVKTSLSSVIAVISGLRKEVRATTNIKRRLENSPKAGSLTLSHPRRYCMTI